MEELGFRFHMANHHGAFGVCQINTIDEILKTRQQACKLYHEELSALEWIIDAPKGDFDAVTPFFILHSSFKWQTV